MLEETTEENSKPLVYVVAVYNHKDGKPTKQYEVAYENGDRLENTKLYKHRGVAKMIADSINHDHAKCKAQIKNLKLI